jgi:hypothetical protein
MYPASGNIELKIYLTISPERTAPAIGNNLLEVISINVVGSVNGRMIMISLAVTSFEYWDHPESVAMPGE